MTQSVASYGLWPGLARLNYRREKSGLIVAERTEILGGLQGTDAALALVERMVQYARGESVKIFALCTYVEVERRQHPEWEDVFYLPGAASAVSK